MRLSDGRDKSASLSAIRLRVCRGIGGGSDVGTPQRLWPNYSVERSQDLTRVYILLS